MKTEKFDEKIRSKLESFQADFSQEEIDRVLKRIGNSGFRSSNRRIMAGSIAMGLLGITLAAMFIWNIELHKKLSQNTRNTHSSEIIKPSPDLNNQTKPSITEAHDEQIDKKGQTIISATSQKTQYHSPQPSKSPILTPNQMVEDNLRETYNKGIVMSPIPPTSIALTAPQTIIYKHNQQNISHFSPVLSSTNQVSYDNSYIIKASADVNVDTIQASVNYRKNWNVSLLANAEFTPTYRCYGPGVDLMFYKAWGIRTGFQFLSTNEELYSDIQEYEHKRKKPFPGISPHPHDTGIIVQNINVSHQIYRIPLSIFMHKNINKNLFIHLVLTSTYDLREAKNIRFDDRHMGDNTFRHRNIQLKENALKQGPILLEAGIGRDFNRWSLAVQPLIGLNTKIPEYENKRFFMGLNIFLSYKILE